MDKRVIIILVVLAISAGLFILINSQPKGTERSEAEWISYLQEKGMLRNDSANTTVRSEILAPDAVSLYVQEAYTPDQNDSTGMLVQGSFIHVNTATDEATAISTYTTTYKAKKRQMELFRQQLEAKFE